MNRGTHSKWKKNTSEKNLNETKISNLPDKEFRVMVRKVLTHIGRMDEHSGNFNKEIEDIREYQIQAIKLKNAVTELKHTVEGSTAD